MQDYWKRIFNLARRSGDRLIVTDIDGSQPCVVMDLDSYEDLLNNKAKKELPLSTPEIPIKSKNENEVLRIWDTIPEARDPAKTWNVSELSEQEQRQLKTVFEEMDQPNHEVPQENKVQKQPTPSIQPDFSKPPSVNHDSVSVNTGQNINIEEDQFYLEPVE